jgi:ribosomal 30S subunit maturation factor RimM
MVQLRTSHVPTQEDEYYWKNIYPKMVRKEIYNLTESDLH